MKLPGTEKFVPAFSHALIILALLTTAPVAFADAEADYQRGREAYRVNDVVGAMAPLKRAADTGHAGAQALYGSILDSAELDEEAVPYLQKAAAQGNMDGEYGLAKMYFTGEAKAPSDVETGRLMRAAASKGHQLAIVTIALAFVRGDKRLNAENSDAQEASEFLLKAAELGELDAIKAVAEGYRGGKYGFTADAAKADQWDSRLAGLLGTSKKGAKK
ncbi:sel1 repeat family protein [Aromatoleum toluclasticum]|uniref:tetratricopeptide repeat protein n=1 Tax=Aromatoleum toluclasticum TaxID=92003 RepID=UPI00036B1BA7|nr:sel1 repeat family protein [Aromatoleum toluclasticum]MCC4114301.1 sel1 repeat family protein [Aromatoleum toluclasticum]